MRGCSTAAEARLVERAQPAADAQKRTMSTPISVEEAIMSCQEGRHLDPSADAKKPARPRWTALTPRRDSLTEPSYTDTPQIGQNVLNAGHEQRASFLVRGLSPERPTRFSIEGAPLARDAPRFSSRARSHRRQGRLRGRRVRRLRGRAGGRAWCGERVSHREQLPHAASPGGAPRGLHGGVAGRRRRARPRAAGDGGGRRIAVRLLHARLRHEPVRRAVPSRPRGAMRSAGAGRQPVPVHGLSSDPRRGAGARSRAARRASRSARAAGAADRSGRIEWLFAPLDRGRLCRHPRRQSRRDAHRGRARISASSRICEAGAGRISSASRRSTSCASARRPASR